MRRTLDGCCSPQAVLSCLRFRASLVIDCQLNVDLNCAQLAIRNEWNCGVASNEEVDNRDWAVLFLVGVLVEWMLFEKS